MAICPYTGNRRTINDAYLPVGIAHDASHIVGTFQGSETSAIQDVTIRGITHNATHTSSTPQGISAVKDEIGNDGILQERSLCHAHKTQTVETLIGIDDAANAVAVTIEHALERIVEGS